MLQYLANDMIINNEVNENSRKITLDIKYSKFIEKIKSSDICLYYTKYSNHHTTFNIVVKDKLLSIDAFPSDGKTERNFNDYFSKTDSDSQNKQTNDYTSIIFHPYNDDDSKKVKIFINELQSLFL